MDPRTALHEAGHAVVAEEKGFAPTRIELCDDGAGRCYFEISVGAETLSRLRRELVVLLAGRIAEYIDTRSDLRSFPARSVLALECSPRMTRWTSVTDFHADVVRLHGRTDDPSAHVSAYRWEEQELRAAADEAAQILRRRWPAVQQLAVRLSESDNGILDLDRRRDGQRDC
jgi:hypothetical protein